MSQHSQVLLLPHSPDPIPLSLARATLSSEEFRARLRAALVSTPQITLSHVASQLGVTRQAVSQLVGRLNRPPCARAGKPAPKLEQARAALPELTRMVKKGIAADVAVDLLGISLNQVMRLGFRAKAFKPLHGSAVKAMLCNCWRCRRGTGAAKSRAPRMGAKARAEVLDWCAWRDPDSDEGLSQAKIGALCGVGQGAVSRVVREASNAG
jgi:predicted transcriptional regulator